MFNQIDKEFTFSVYVSNLPGGLNGALYVVQINPSSGTSWYPDIGRVRNAVPATAALSAPLILSSSTASRTDSPLLGARDLARRR
jgi:hypothetical protein